ncbi:MAG: transcription elongation factor GreA [Chloroflexi bacterium]|nr:MAG: transcription elongation factor GreA [Chloroflexota bacterium]TMF03108.1 MAG: transcription elongation factor GreA [Chloroflexota bacterium]
MARLTVRLTPEGRRELEEELARREAELPIVSARLGDARAGGNDPAENLDLRDAMDALALLEGRVGELRALLAAAEPIEDLPARDGVIRLGARFKIRHEDGEEASYMLVSPAEADPRRGRISEESPIGRALLGRKKSEEVTADTPSGPERLKILDVG